MKKGLKYSDISLIPNKCVVSSRSECDTSFRFGNYVFEMPVFPSNMTSVVDEETCIFLSEHKYFYVMHRFNIDVLAFSKKMLNRNFPLSLSVGVNDESKQNLKLLKKENISPDYITIDIAHGWCNKMKEMISYIKNEFEDVFVIAGNVTTNEASLELEEWGADALKVSIGTGGACITRNKTGFYMPIVDAIIECSKSVKIPIIADGGLSEHGDIAKALVMGASAVMAGSLFSGYDQSAGQIIDIDGKKYKEYFGNASQYNKKEYKNIEGKKLLVEYKGDMTKLLVELKEDLQSSISYAGGKDLSAFNKVEYIFI